MNRIFLRFLTIRFTCLACKKYSKIGYLKTPKNSPLHDQVILMFQTVSLASPVQWCPHPPSGQWPCKHWCQHSPLGLEGTHFQASCSECPIFPHPPFSERMLTVPYLRLKTKGKSDLYSDVYEGSLRAGLCLC